MYLIWYILLFSLFFQRCFIGYWSFFVNFKIFFLIDFLLLIYLNFFFAGFLLLLVARFLIARVLENKITSKQIYRWQAHQQINVLILCQFLSFYLKRKQNHILAKSKAVNMTTLESKKRTLIFLKVESWINQHYAKHISLREKI